jgi:hypothetical protein
MSHDNVLAVVANMLAVHVTPATQNHVQAGLVILDHNFALIDPEHEDDPDLLDKITRNVTVTNNRFQKNGCAPVTGESLRESNRPPPTPIVPLLYGDIVYIPGAPDAGNCFANIKYRSAALLTVGDGGLPAVKRYKPAQFNALFPCS